jgi:hypothetical protein
MEEPEGSMVKVMIHNLLSYFYSAENVQAKEHERGPAD